MMSTHKSIRLEKQHEDAIEDLDNRGVADNESEAHRMLLAAGMREFGYEAGGYQAASPLSWVAGEFARAFAWIGVAWLALTALFPVVWRMGAVFALLASLGCVVVRHVVDEYDGVALRSRGEQA